MSQEQIQKTGQTAGIIDAQQLDPATLQALQDATRQARSGLSPAALKAAEKLASETKLDTLDKLFSPSDKTRSAISSVANEMIGATKLGEVEHVNQLFSRFGSVDKELDVSRVHRPLSLGERLRNAFAWLPGITVVDRLMALLERYQSVKGKIAELKLDLGKRRTAQMTSKEQFKELKGAVLGNFEAYEIMIAAAEMVLERETRAYIADFNEATAGGKQLDIRRAIEFKDRYKKIVRLDNRLMSFQIVRVDMVMNFTVIDMAIDNADNLIATLKELEEQTIPQLEMATGIAIQVYQQRQTAQVGSETQKRTSALRSANLEALGHAQEEIHGVATYAAREAEAVVAAMEKLGSIVQRGTELLAQNRELNMTAREKLKEAEDAFQKLLEEDARKAAEEAARG